MESQLPEWLKGMRLTALGVVMAFAVAACAGPQEEPATTGGGGGEQQAEEVAEEPEQEQQEQTAQVEEETQEAAQEEEPPPPPIDFVDNVGDRVFFGFDRSTLTDEAQATIRRQVEWLDQYPEISVTIEGHTDERGTREYNLALGERRATAVRDYMVALGIDPSRIETISYGKERPAVEGSNEAAWSQNRRAVTVVEPRGVGS